MKKCDCYERVLRKDLIGYVYGCDEICNGTINREECSCGGDPTRCDFYPEKREAAFNEELAEKFGEFCKKNSTPTSTNVTTIYYAHHQWKYGTKIEEYELDLIKQKFPHAAIFNPATELKVDGRTEDDIMAECLEIVNKSDVVIFSSMNGSIGIGVYKEIEAARDAGKLVLYIYQNRLTTEFRRYLTPEHNSDRLYADVCADMCSD